MHVVAVVVIVIIAAVVVVVVALVVVDAICLTAISPVPGLMDML